jgi:4-amino-4-deoxy-L-arabinose transferase-like glycosyltransferase
MLPSSQPGSRSYRGELTWLIAILGLSLVLRLALVPGRWINPDEGAHLMDGRLALDGLLPFVDFDSRQIAYTYVLAAFLRLSHGSYEGVRLGLVVVTVANVGLVYLIARRLFDGRVGITAALVYAVQPLAVIWSPIVHTEPVTILATCLGILCLVRHVQTPGDRLGILLAGVFLSLAFYARESALGVVAAVVVVLAVESWREPGLLARRYGLLALGFVLPCAGFTLLYLGRLGVHGWWTSSLNPLYILMAHLPNIGKAGLAGASPAGPGGTVRGGQASPITMAYLGSVALLCATLLAGFAAALGLGPGRLGGERWRGSPPRPDLLLLSWLGGLFLVYAYWTAHRGFFPQYAEEFLAPLAILTGAVVTDLIRLSLPTVRFGLALGLLMTYPVAAFALSHFMGRELPLYTCFLIPALALSLTQLAAGGRVRGWAAVVGIVLVMLALGSSAVGAPVGVRRALKLALIPTVLAGVYAAAGASPQRRRLFLALSACTAFATLAGYSFSRAGSIIDLKYETVWAPETLRTVADIIRRGSSAGDRVMSGGVIWELEAGRRPFANVTHPLGFLLGNSAGEPERLARELVTTPPRFVVFDGYTERTYGLLLPRLGETLAERYQLVADLPGLHYPVRVYQLREPGPPS